MKTGNLKNKCQIIFEKVPKGYGSKVFWEVNFGAISNRQTSKLFKNKSEALKFAETKIEETTSPLGIFIGFRDSSIEEVKNRYEWQNK